MTLDTPSRRREIENAASVLFWEHGYAGTSIRDIARVLEMQGASLYAHVTSKEDMLWAIVDRAAQRFETAATGAQTSTSGRPPSERLAALVRAHVGVVTSDVGASAVFATEWRSLTGDRRAQILTRRDAYERRFRDVVVDGMAVGEFAVTDPSLAAAWILTALNGLASWYRPDGPIGADRIADHFADYSVRALTETFR